MKKIISVFVFACVLGLAGAAAQSGEKVEISFTYTPQGGPGSNQFAVWIEDSRGRCVKTLYATRFTARGGWRKREQSLPLWVQKSGADGLREKEIDAFTSATPRAGVLTYRWDGMDAAGKALPPGEYGVYVEATLRGENRVLYSASVRLGGEDGEAEVKAQYFGTDIAGRVMIGGVRVKAGS